MEANDKPVVLVVDDEPVNIDLLRESLKDQYKIMIATRGAQAISIAEKKLPDLILLDIMMPEMDGYEACEKLKETEATKDIPVIFISALNEIEDKSVGFDMGAAAFITKPFDVKEVFNLVEAFTVLKKQDRIIAQYEKKLKNSKGSGLDSEIIEKIQSHIKNISGNAQIIKLFWTVAGPILNNHIDEDETGRVGDTIDKFEDLINNMIQNVRDVTSLLDEEK